MQNLYTCLFCISLHLFPRNVPVLVLPQGIHSVQAPSRADPCSLDLVQTWHLAQLCYCWLHPASVHQESCWWQGRTATAKRMQTLLLLLLCAATLLCYPGYLQCVLKKQRNKRGFLQEQVGQAKSVKLATWCSRLKGMCIWNGGEWLTPPLPCSIHVLLARREVRLLRLVPGELYIA